jgi:hypothetical protein
MRSRSRTGDSSSTRCHNVYTALGNLGVAPRIRDALLGHEGHGMAATYDKGPDWRLRKAGMAKLKYPAKVERTV